MGCPPARRMTAASVFALWAPRKKQKRRAPGGTRGRVQRRLLSVREVERQADPADEARVVGLRVVGGTVDVDAGVAEPRRRREVEPLAERPFTGPHDVEAGAGSLELEGGRGLRWVHVLARHRVDAQAAAHAQAEIGPR